MGISRELSQHLMDIVCSFHDDSDADGDYSIRVKIRKSLKIGRIMYYRCGAMPIKQKLRKSHWVRIMPWELHQLKNVVRCLQNASTRCGFPLENICERFIKFEEEHTDYRLGAGMIYI